MIAGSAPIGPVTVARLERLATVLDTALGAVACAEAVADDAVRLANVATSVEILAGTSAVAEKAVSDVARAERRLMRIARLTARLSSRIDARLAAVASVSAGRPR